MASWETDPEGAIKALVLEDNEIFEPLKELNKAGGKERLVPPRGKVCGGLGRHRFHPELEKQINKIINVCYSTSYLFHAMSSYFNRDCVALPGLATFFLTRSTEERERAVLFTKYMARRGGHVEFLPIREPEVKEFYDEEVGDALHAMELCVGVEKVENEKFLALNKAAEEAMDEQLSDFLTDEIIDQQVEMLHKHAKFVTQLRHVGKGHGHWHWDHALYKELTGNQGLAAVV